MEGIVWSVAAIIGVFVLVNAGRLIQFRIRYGMWPWQFPGASL